jgi:rhamnose utilization protein RhaD (predicted bifunctional aldolase and dehydrogenase)
MRVLTEEGTNMADTIVKTKAPALALSPTTFSQQHFDLYSQQLRVYFNTLDTANGQTIQQVNSLTTMVWLGI